MEFEAAVQQYQGIFAAQAAQAAMAPGGAYPAASNMYPPPGYTGMQQPMPMPYPGMAQMPPYGITPAQVASMNDLEASLPIAGVPPQMNPFWTMYRQGGDNKDQRHGFQGKGK